MMKKSFLMIGALCMGAAFVSCVDDSESTEVKDLRQLQLSQEQAKLDQTYWDKYEAAINNVKQYQSDLEAAQENLDGVKSGNLTHTAVKEAAIAYQNVVIARNKKDISDKNAEITAQKAMEGKTYEEIAELKIKADNDKENAKKALEDYWIAKTNEGYNLSYDKYTGAQSVDASSADNMINMLLGSYVGTQKVAYRNNKLSKNEWVMALNKILDNDGYSYQDGNGLWKTSTDYTFSFTWDPGEDFGHVTDYDAEDMLSSQNISLYADNGYAYQTYKKYAYKDVKQFVSALSLYISNDETGKKGLEQVAEAAKDAFGEGSDSYKDAVTALNKYKALRTKIKDLITVLNDKEKYAAYTDLLNQYAGFANEIRAFGAEVDKATAIASVYSKSSASDNEKTIKALEDAIKGYNKAIADATEEINNIENAIVDDATAQKYYEALIADLNTQIAVNNAIAEKYRALILGSTSSNTQNTTPAETTAE